MGTHAVTTIINETKKPAQIGPSLNFYYVLNIFLITRVTILAIIFILLKSAHFKSTMRIWTLIA